MPTDAQRRNLAGAHHAEVQSLNERIALLESVLRQAREALRVTGNAVNVLWVSHHANRGDFALESADKAIAAIDAAIAKKATDQ